MRGEPVPRAEVPAPDEETLHSVAALKAKGRLEESEAELLRYFDLLEQIRVT